MTPPLVSSSLRVYTEPVPDEDSDDTPLGGTGKGPPPVNDAMLVDIETETRLSQRILFGSARAYRMVRAPRTWDRQGTAQVMAPVVTAEDIYGRCQEWLFYADDLPVRKPKHFRIVVSYALHHKIKLWKLSEWLREVLWPAIKNGSYVVGYNIPFDLSRMARQYGTARTGIRGFTFNYWTYEDKEGRTRQSLYRPRVRIRQLGPHSRSIEWSAPEKGLRPNSPPLGGIIDVSQLVFALTDTRQKLRVACVTFNCKIGKGDPGEHGKITSSYIDYCRRDVAATGELLAACLTELELRWPGLHPTRTYTPASLGKSALRNFGLPPTKERWPGFPREPLGEAMAAYFGGRTECRIRRSPVPVVVCDFLSQYPTVCALLRVWRLLTSQHMGTDDCTGWLAGFLQHIAQEGPSAVLEPRAWQGMVGFARVVCNGDVAVPVRAAFAEHSKGTIEHRTAVSILTADEPCVYSIPDLVASVLLIGQVPEIVSAWRLTGEGQVDGLSPLDVEGIGRIDPYQDDPYVKWIELRKRIAADKSMDEHERRRLVRALKIVANATAYGLLVQCTQKEGTSGDLYVVTDDDMEVKHVKAVEEFGEFAFPPLGALITAGGRLLLAIAERLVDDLGGTFAFCDTDSIAIVSTKNGGTVPCPGGYDRMPDGEDAVRALSHAQVTAVCQAFDKLNPYDPEAVKGSILEVEEYCRDDQEIQSATCYGVSSKRYVLYREGMDGNREIVKATEHGLGRYLVPLDVPDDEDEETKARKRKEWYESVWLWALGRDLDGGEDFPYWAERIAAAYLPIQTPHSLKLLDGYNASVEPDERIRPYSFAMTASEYGRQQRVCIAPRSDNPRQWEAMDWWNRDNALEKVRLVRPLELFTDCEAWLDVPNPGHLPLVKAKTFRQVLPEWVDNPEPKLAGPDGRPCDRKTVGLLRRRHVRISADTTWYRGRGNLSDDDDYDLVEGAKVTVYRDPTKHIMRQMIADVGIKEFAEIARSKLKTVEHFVEGQSVKKEVYDRYLRKLTLIARRETGIMHGDAIKLMLAFLEAKRKARVQQGPRVLTTKSQDRVCPGCSKTFVPDDDQRQYCTNNCRTATKQRRYRARKQRET